MALCPHNGPMRSSNHVPIVIIDNGSRESYLLATLEHLGVIVLPIRSCPTIRDRRSTILNSARWLIMIPVIISVITVVSLHRRW